MDLHAVSCFLILLTCAGVCFGQELILPDGRDIKAGTDVEITPLRIPDPTPFLFRWLFNGTVIINVYPGGNEISPPYIGRVSVNTNTLALELRSLTERDTGQYTLTAERGLVQFTGQTSLRVWVPASNISIIPSKAELVEFNSTVSLVCSASGSSLSFIWLNGSSEVTAGERVQLTDNNRNLIITSVIRADKGPYQCNASNSFSSAKSPPLSLNIYYGPESVTVVAAPVGPFYSSGSNLKLTCSADSRPAAEFQWSVNGAELGKMSRELELSNIQSSHSGSYNCMAHNKQSLRYSTSEPISITVLDKILDAEIIGPTYALIANGVFSATLTCKAKGTIHSAEWKKDDQKLSANENITFSHNNRSVTISPVGSTDSGVYQCTLSNPISNDTGVVNMTVKLPYGGQGDSLSAGAIAGIVIGVLLGVAGIAGLIFYIVKDKKMPSSSRNKKNGATPNDQQHEMHYADINHRQSNQGQQGVPAIPRAQLSQHNKTATSNPAGQTIYSDVKNI